MSENVSEKESTLTELQNQEDEKHLCENTQIQDTDSDETIPIKESEMHSAIMHHSSSITHSGPLPHPEILRGYEECLSGAAERVLVMAEKEQAHRHEFDDKCQRTDSRDSLLGILSATFLGIASLITGMIVIIKIPNQFGAVSGTFLGVSGIGSIVATFIKGTKVTWKIKDKE